LGDFFTLTSMLKITEVVHIFGYFFTVKVMR
jgi:hypothetical protein